MTVTVTDQSLTIWTHFSKHGGPLQDWKQSTASSNWRLLWWEVCCWSTILCFVFPVVYTMWWLKI